MRWKVEVTRTEYLTFEVEADTVEEATDRYSAHGEEVDADILNDRVESVTLATDSPQRRMPRLDNFDAPGG